MTYSKMTTFLKALDTFLGASVAVLAAVIAVLPADEATWQAALAKGWYGLAIAALLAAWRALENYRKNGGVNGYPLWLWPWNSKVAEDSKAGNWPPDRPKAGLILLCLGLAAIMALGGCQTLKAFAGNERAQYLACSKAFEGTVHTLAGMRERGKFTAGEADKITVAIGECKLLLADWGDSLKAGTPKPDALRIFDTIINQLNAYMEK